MTTTTQISRHDAEFKRAYLVRFMGQPSLGTLKQFAAGIINTEWQYSWYWDTHGKDWVETAKADCKKRIDDVTAELARLLSMKDLLDSVEPLPTYEDEQNDEASSHDAAVRRRDDRCH